MTNGDKAPLLSAIPPPNVAPGNNISFTLQPVNLPPLTVTVPNILIPPATNTNTTSEIPTATTVVPSTTDFVTQPNLPFDPSQFARYVETFLLLTD